MKTSSRWRAMALAGAAALAALATGGHAEDLPLAAGETVEVLVYGRDDLSGQRVIDSSGLLLVPLLGRVQAAGSTGPELEATIADGLAAAGLLEEPDVFVEVRDRRDVFVGGAVRNPGGLTWAPGATVEQVVTQAGGPRVAPGDEFGTLLQAYGTVADFQALLRSIAELEARETRLRAETVLADLIFGPAEAGNPPVPAGALPDGADTLDLSAFLASDARGDDPAAVLGVLARYDIAQFRRLRQDRPDLALVRFPERIAADPALVDVRETQQDLVANHLAVHLADFDALGLRREAFDQQIAALDEQRGLLEESLAQLEAEIENVRSLREQGLARGSDLLELQSTYATLLSSRVALLAARAEAENQILQQDLARRGFAASLRGALAEELEAVRGQLGDLRSREDQGRLAATVAAAYRGTDGMADADPPLRYQIRRGGRGDLVPAEAVTEVQPGDMVIVSLAEGLD